MNYNKSRKVWRKYLTRKDNVKRENSIQKSPKKKLRKISNSKVRLYKLDVSNGGWYKKVWDLWWTLY
jgi:hypothetical protein